MLSMFLRKKRKGGEKPQRVSVPTDKIQVTGYLEVLEIREAAHEVMSDRPPRRELTQHFHLNALELPDRIGGESLKIKAMRRTRVSGRTIRQFNLVKVPILQTPEDITPSSVQGFDILIVLSQPTS